MNLIIRHMGIAACYVFALVASPSSATIGLPGTLDPFWATGSPFGAGKVVTAVGAGTDVARAVALQPDGKVLLAGYCSNGANNDFCLVRYLPNGTLDTSWNGTGSVMTAIGSLDDVGNAMTLQPDGKVLLAGNCALDFCAVRYLPNGTLDLTWNSTGKVITPMGAAGDYGDAIVLQPDGKVLLAGYCYNGPNTEFCSVRYLPHGVPDPTWNGTGTVFTAITVGTVANAMTLQPDGKLLLAGYCYTGVTTDFCAARYDGGPFGYQNCKPDLDGDGSFLATTDALMYTRVALGITGPAVVAGITFASGATRNTWPLIREYLITQCGMSLVP